MNNDFVTIFKHGIPTKNKIKYISLFIVYTIRYTKKLYKINRTKYTTVKEFPLNSATQTL